MEYYGMTDEEQMVLLGNFDDWEAASEAADEAGAITRIFDRPSVMRFRESIDVALGAQGNE